MRGGAGLSRLREAGPVFLGLRLALAGPSQVACVVCTRPGDYGAVRITTRV